MIAIPDTNVAKLKFLPIGRVFTSFSSECKCFNFEVGNKCKFNVN